MNSNNAAAYRDEFVIIFAFLVLWGFAVPWIFAAVIAIFASLACAWHSPVRYWRLLFVAAFVFSPVLIGFADSLTRERSGWVHFPAIFLSVKPSIVIAAIAMSRIDKPLRRANGD